MRHTLWIFTALLWLTVGTVYAQESTVPDVTGLNTAQAAAELNRAGLRLGQQNVEPWAEDAPVPPGSIASQSIAPGETAAGGTAVDVTLYSGTKLTLIYDDNDLTLINDTGENIALGGIQFASADRRFHASRWRGDLPSGDCTQVWSVGRNQPKAVGNCESTYWLVTTDRAEHFWTPGAENFNIVQDGDTRATCPAAPPNSQNSPTTCEFYIATGSASASSTEFIYFAYTTDRFAVINRSDDSWMPLTETSIYNYNPAIQVQGASLKLSDSSLFNPDTIIANPERLAPGQCLMITVAPLSDAQPPEPCDLIAQRALTAEVIFWSAPFELDAPTGERSQCPAATEGRLTLCIMPR